MSASCSCYHYTLGHFDISPLWYPAPLMSRFKCPLDVPTTTVPLGRKKLRKGTLMYSLILLPAYYGTFPTILLCKNRLCACKTIACSLDLLTSKCCTTYPHAETSSASSNRATPVSSCKHWPPSAGRFDVGAFASLSLVNRHKP